jgi:AcrR family transcriptional regulator
VATQLSTETRERLLAAAGPVFAARGFKEATVREICQAAGVNIAAVNYYFGDKERLYIEAVKLAHCDRINHHPPPSWSDGTPPARKLHDFVRVLLARMLQDPSEAWHTQLMLRELLQPTAACVELVRDYIKPQFSLLLEIIDELLPVEAPLERRHLIAFSIVGQCLYHRIARPVIELLVSAKEFADYTGDHLADHITQLSLAAIDRAAAEARHA